jgi:DNA-binding response OmpR family regulator
MLGHLESLTQSTEDLFREHDRRAVNMPHPRPSAGGEGDALNQEAARRLLIVEDEPRVASFLVKGLKAQGFSVDHVTTGADALARCEEDGPRLIVLDLGLPDIDGLEVLRRLRDAGNEVPVIILTARGSDEDRRSSRALGAVAYITKPFAFGHLAEQARAHLPPGDAA